ncbi:MULTISPECIES: DUF1216 domain-containing protein [Alteribacter]|uniref:DUF1216 domain-containing protein n=1 Tax=Alteribacter keqinensis TaxID=2483800 RepID=A0A3M7TVI7_9BACI|nr:MULTISPECIES: DUF1216 domain-containing protein [Alteribacter]MBM7094303.1 DUF1216 domain-containing protein [Alteribacter salitolerans]RNA69463.1 DUF1216 domain-containing protein [Alteribacter keqinensis]
MPYHKNKQQAFQAAQQAFVQLQGAMNDLAPDDADYGHHHKAAEQELNEAMQVIQKAHVNASEHQKQQLRIYEEEVRKYQQQLMEE